MNGQTQEGGRKGDHRGRTLASRIICALGYEQLSLRSNEFKIGDKLAAVKTAYTASNFVVTDKMLSRLDWVICAVVVERNGKKCIVDLYKLTSDEFLEFSTPSKSKSHAKGKAWSIRKSVVIDDIRLFKRGVQFPLPEDPDI